METIGRVYLSLGLNAEARPQLEKALVMREQLFPDDNAAKASNLSALGKLEQNVPAASNLQPHTTEDALAMNERLHGRTNIAVAASLEELGQLLKVQGDFKGAETQLQESLALFTEMRGSRAPRACPP